MKTHAFKGIRSLPDISKGSKEPDLADLPQPQLIDLFIRACKQFVQRIQKPAQIEEIKALEGQIAAIHSAIKRK